MITLCDKVYGIQKLWSIGQQDQHNFVILITDVILVAGRVGQRGSTTSRSAAAIAPAAARSAAASGPCRRTSRDVAGTTTG